MENKTFLDMEKIPKVIGYVVSAVLGIIVFELFGQANRNQNHTKRKKILTERFTADPELLKKYNEYGLRTTKSAGQRGTLAFPWVKISSVEEIENLDEKQSAYAFCLLEELDKKEKEPAPVAE